VLVIAQVDITIQALSSKVSVSNVTPHA